MKLSIKWILTASFIFLIGGMQAVFHITSHVWTERVLANHVQNIMSNIAASTMEKSVGYFNVARGSACLTQRLISNGILGRSDWALMERYFQHQLAIHPQFAGMYFARPNGDFFYLSRNTEYHPQGFRTKHIIHQGAERQVQLIYRNSDFQELQRHMDPEDTYDPRTRPWYQKSVKNHDLAWTDPYLFYTSQKPGITAAVPLYDAEGVLEGVVGVDIEIDELSYFLSDLEIGRSGKAFILNQHNEVVAYHDINRLKYQDPMQNGQLRLVKIDELGDPVALAAFQAANLPHSMMPGNMSNLPEFVRIKYRNEAYIGAFTSFTKKTQWPWIIGIYMPENDYLGGIRRNMQQLYLVALAITLLAVGIGFLIARLVVRPIANLEKEAQAVKQQDFLKDFDTHSTIIEIDSLARSFKDMRQALQAYKDENIRLQEEVKHSHLTTIYRLAAASEFKDKDTADHLRRISAYAATVARQMNFSKEEIDLIKYASPMHDVGKIGIPDVLIHKNGELTHEERQAIEQHTNIGGQILAPIDSKLMDTARQIALHHHEKWDGSGYPQGVSGEDIPIMARIVSLVDVFDALLSERSYKERILFDTAVEMIQAGRGTHFDPQCVDAFLQCLDEIRDIYRRYSEAG